MGLATKWLLRYLCAWFAMSLCILEPASAENSVTWFIRMQHSVVPLRTRVEPKVHVDTLARTVELSFSRLRKSEVRHLRAQIKTGGGKMIWVRNKGRKTKMLLRFPYRNILVLYSVEKNPRRFVMDVGTGRYLLPEAPFAKFSERVKDAFAKKTLLLSERLLTAGKANDAVEQLEKLASRSNDAGLMACMRLADIAMINRQETKAGLMAGTCLQRCRALNSPLESLAMLRMISYKGFLFSTQLELQLADLEPEPGSTDWVSQEYYFQLARVHFARGEYEKALARAVMLCRAFKDSKRASDLSPMAVSAMDRIVEAGKKVGKFASISLALLDGVRWIPSIPSGRFVRLVRLTADALLKAGAPKMAADLLTWHLRSMAGKRVDVGVLRLLSMAFLKVGDSYRASRTLDFLLAQEPAKSIGAEVLELRSMVLTAEGKKQEALDSLAAALGSSNDSALIERVAHKLGTMFLESGDRQKGLLLVSGAIERVSGGKKGKGLSDLLILQGDLAYLLKNKKVAKHAYESFIRLFPKDQRRQMALYRLQRMGRAVVDLISPDDLKDNSVWSLANDVFRQGAPSVGTSP